jgi:hypothetical protein
MSLKPNTAERLRRATALWHAYLTIAGQRFELAMFLKDPQLENQVIAGALAHGDPKLVTLAQDWLLATGQAVPAVVAARAIPVASTAPVPPVASAEAAKPGRYLRGVR